MNPYDPTALIHTLKTHEEVFICGPSRGSSNENPNTHLRVYANGGRLCDIPTTNSSEILISSFQYLPEETQEMLKQKEKYNIALNKKDGSRKVKNEKREEFLMNEMNLLLDAIKNKFTSEKSSEDKSSKDKSLKERHNQTVIARKHRDFQAHKRIFTGFGQSAPREYLTVVCDFETTIPKLWGRPASSHLKSPEKEGKNSKCDLVAFSCTQDISDPWIISIIELKCNKHACWDKKSGLTAHAKDMAIYMPETKEVPNRSDCMTETEDVPNRSDYILEILRRLSYMLRYGLLENVPDGLEAVVNRLLPKSWTDQEQMRQSRKKVRSRDISLRSCFLFTGDDDIRADDNQTKRSQDAVKLCQEAEYLKDHLKKYCYQFRKDPSDVDLSDMECWDSFFTGS